MRIVHLSFCTATRIGPSDPALLSTQRWLAGDAHGKTRNRAPEGAQVVTSDHFDLDGLASIFAFLSPASAMKHQQLLIDVARLGDFSRGASSHALKAAYTFNNLAT